MKYLIVFILILSCNPQKRIARQDEKAINYVSAKKPLLDRLTPIVLAIHPCVTEVVRTDSITTYIIDTITQKINVPYSVYKNKVLDTIINDISIYISNDKISLKYLGVQSVIIKTKTITQEDLSKVNRLLDTINIYKIKEATFKGQILQFEKQLNEEINQKQKWCTRFYLLFAILLTIHGILVYIKFKSKLPLI